MQMEVEMRKEYAIECNRETAILYGAWEWGVANVRRILNANEKRFGNIRLYHLPVSPDRNGYPTRRAAEAYRNRIRETVAFQKGKLGKAYTDAFARIVEVSK
jgi:hypothetical protein